MFAIVKSCINEIYKEWKRTQQISIKQSIDPETSTPIVNINVKRQGKDISAWLGDDDK